MNLCTKLPTFALLCFAVAGLSNHAFAQKKQHVSFKSAAENSKYTQRHAIDVGDVPNHQVRVYEIHRTFPTDPPVINGEKLKEQWTRATSDYVDNSGSFAKVPHHRIASKAERNEPCPCGSDKRFKHCCGRITLH